MSIRSRVLIVDDSPDSRLIYARHLRNEPYDIAVAADGETALTLISESPPDLMLLDNMLPGISGLEVLQRLRNDPITADLPIVMITAHNSTMRPRALELGADDFISVPLEPVELKVRLRNLLRMRQTTRERAILAIRQKLMEEQMQEADELSRNIVHDLKNPLFCMRLLGDTLLRYRESLPPAVQNLAPVLRKEADSCLSLVEELLNFLRDSYQQEICGVIDLGQLLSTIVDELLPLIEASGAILQIAPDLPEQLNVQPQRIARVWRNLLSNAIKYSQNSATPIIKISYSQQEYFHCFSISDNGVGIPPEYRDEIFLPFRRVTSESEVAAPEEQTIGHGVGLAIVKKIIDQHGGRVWIAEREGPGTEVLFTLPKQVICPANSNLQRSVPALPVEH
ncbi:response regulator [Leptolyngbya sp. FACHB-261]|uniref:sensor histidine kinase n=1 Tax=Leptolyngbya sp. FACHB-261 TaxID=2692806 RepID=UPI0016888EB7|nr:hybrid sensor histidine kinase/response regulator [Leptolyngbya sp. FACHB-261]MBD2102287.1 hybrid sensor histidine kinase/response regulator [Leptolyngbya sp. FACHB-261]